LGGLLNYYHRGEKEGGRSGLRIFELKYLPEGVDDRNDRNRAGFWAVFMTRVRVLIGDYDQDDRNKKCVIAPNPFNKGLWGC
jgi:hypothetical protein